MAQGQAGGHGTSRADFEGGAVVGAGVCGFRKRLRHTRYGSSWDVASSRGHDLVQR